MSHLDALKGLSRSTRDIQRRTALDKRISEMLTDPDKMIAFHEEGGIEEMVKLLGQRETSAIVQQMLQEPKYSAYIRKKTLVNLATLPIRLPVRLLRHHTKKTITAILVATQLDGCQNALHLPPQVDYIDFFNKQGDFDLKVGPDAWDGQSDQEG